MLTDDQYIDYYRIRVVLAKLPGNVKAFSVPNMDSYTVTVNNDLGPVEQQDAVHHELTHIQHNDHYNADFREYA